jgi:aldehyde dehydrogenase (NAD+)
MTDTNFAHYVDQSSLLIDGKLIPAERGRTFTSINPATEEVIGSAPDASLADAGRAVESSWLRFVRTSRSSAR